jgi:hypothetical protein
MIAHRQKAIDESGQWSDEEEKDHFKPQILIDQMIRISMDETANHRFSIPEIRDESFTMVIAVSEQTSSMRSRLNYFSSRAVKPPL